MCIIRDKPITARNACQAVKRYPGPQPGGLMISLGKLDHLRPSSSFSYPSPPSRLLPIASTSFHVFFIHSPRETHYHCAHCYPLSPGGTTSSGQQQRHDATTNHSRVPDYRDDGRQRVSFDRFGIFRARGEPTPGIKIRDDRDHFDNISLRKLRYCV